MFYTKNRFKHETATSCIMIPIHLGDYDLGEKQFKKKRFCLWFFSKKCLLNSLYCAYKHLQISMEIFEIIFSDLKMKKAHKTMFVEP